MKRGKVKAPCRPALLGDKGDQRFFALPISVVQSAAYRDLSVHARAVLVEIGKELRGWNNGRLGISSREIQKAVRCSSRKVVTSVTELMEHGLIDIAADGSWQNGTAREYRITFYSTANGPATNDYIHWTPKEPQKRVSGGEALRRRTVSPAATVGEPTASDVTTVEIKNGRNQPTVEPTTASDADAHLNMPYLGRTNRGPMAVSDTLNHSIEAKQQCERCGEPFALRRADEPASCCFCSQRCREAAESARTGDRSTQNDDGVRIGVLLRSTISRALAEAG